MLKVVGNGAAREAGEAHCELDEIARMGARRMLMAALAQSGRGAAHPVLARAFHR